MRLTLLSWVILLTASAAAQRGMVAVSTTHPAAAGPSGAISYIASCTGTTACASVPAHLVGDLFIVGVGRDGSTTAPTLASGWTSVSTPRVGSSSTASIMRVACKVATTTSETVTGFTNGGALVAHIYRGARAGTTATCASAILGTPVNECAGSATVSSCTSYSSSTSTTVTYGSVTNSDAAGWTAGFAYAPAATLGLDTAPTGMSARGLSGTTKLAGNDTNGAVSSFTTADVTVTTAGRTVVSTFEIKAAQPATPTFSPASGTPPQTVTISSSTSGADSYIYWNTTGSPTTSDTHSTSASVSTDPTTLYAKVIGMTGWSDSAIGNATYASVAFPHAGVLDDFNRADTGPPPSASWSALDSNLPMGDWKVVSNQAVVNSLVNTYAGDYYNVATYGPDSDVYATIVTLPTSGLMQLIERGSGLSSSATFNGYTLEFDPPSSLKMGKVTTGTPTQLGSTLTQTVSAGDSIGMSATGTTTVTLTVYYKSGAGAWTQVGTTTDSSPAAALQGAGNVGVLTNNANTVIDNFGGGTR